MSEALREASEHLGTAMDRAAEARRAAEVEPGEAELEDGTVMDAIHSALYDIDYALAKATWTTKDYVNQAVDAADEGYDDLLEDLEQARKGLVEFREDLAESRPSRAISQWFASLETRLGAMMERLKGDGED